jgi:quercetin dioxygenase-like cupin family protein
MFFLAKDCAVTEVGPGVTRQVLGHIPELMAVRVTFKKGSIGYVHTHPHRQVTYVECGRFEATMGDQRREIGPGDTYVALPDVPHGVVALEDGVLIDVFTPQRDDFLAS